MRPTEATLDLAALRANVQLCRRLAPTSKILAVVKANAYGHGADLIATTLAGQVEGFAVATLEEALVLRNAGLEAPILLLEGFFERSELAEIQNYHLDFVVASPEQVEILLQYPARQPSRVWLKLDSGMHRLGLDARHYLETYERLRSSPAVSEIVLMSHFAAADRTTSTSTLQQIERVERVTAALPSPMSLANSAAILAWPTAHRDWVRPGLMLYGVSPLDCGNPAAGELRPVMRLASALSLVRELEAGEAVGYGGRFVCTERTRIGVVPVGYADGYPQQAPDGTPVLVGGRRSRIVGQVSMDMLTVDLTRIPEARIGSPVELWGPNLAASEVAEACGTIPYTLFTGVSARVRRRTLSRDEG